MSGTSGEQQAVQLSVHDIQGLKDEAKEYAGNENLLKSSTHESDLESASHILMHIGINWRFCENSASGSVCLGGS